MVAVPAPPAAPGSAGDAQLAARAASGDEGAFADLYRRHAAAAWRVAMAVTSNREDAADAVSDAFIGVLGALRDGRLEEGRPFRPYLLTAARNRAIDVIRRRAGAGCPEPAGAPTAMAEATPPVVESGAARAARVRMPTAAPASDPLLERLDASLALAAFRGLPERWRTALWLTDVEGMATADAGAVLGLSANGVAQLAVRARAGLRQRFVQAHLRATTVPPACRFCVDRLGAYLAGGLSARDLAKVDQHLAACPECSARRRELDDLGLSLRAAAMPVPVALAGLAASRWRSLFVTGGARRFVPAAWGSGPAGGAGPQQALRPLATCCAGLLALGMIGLGVVGQPRHPGGVRTPVPGGPGAAGPLVTPPEVSLAARTVQLALTEGPGRTAPSLSAAPMVPTVTQPAGSPARPAPAGPPVPATPPGGTGPPVPLVQMAVAVSAPGGPLLVGLAVGTGPGSCTGASTAAGGAGCPVPAGPPGSVVAASTSGSAVPPLSPHLP